MTTYRAACFDCTWTTASDDGDAVSKAAEKHTRDERHGTLTSLGTTYEEDDDAGAM